MPSRSAISPRASSRSAGSRRTDRCPSCASSRTRTTSPSPLPGSAVRRARGRLRQRTGGSLLVLGTSGRHGSAAGEAAGCDRRVRGGGPARSRRRAGAAARARRLRRDARARRGDRRRLPGRPPRCRVHLARAARGARCADRRARGRARASEPDRLPHHASGRRRRPPVRARLRPGGARRRDRALAGDPGRRVRRTARARRRPRARTRRRPPRRRAGSHGPTGAPRAASCASSRTRSIRSACSIPGSCSTRTERRRTGAP